MPPEAWIGRKLHQAGPETSLVHEYFGHVENGPAHAQTIGNVGSFAEQSSLRAGREEVALKVLLAQFHPYADDRTVMAVARVICDVDRAWLEPVTMDGRFATTAGMLAKLRYLVEQGGTHPFERLPLLRSRFWSFVQVEGPGLETEQ